MPSFAHDERRQVRPVSRTERRHQNAAVRQTVRFLLNNGASPEIIQTIEDGYTEYTKRHPVEK